MDQDTRQIHEAIEETRADIAQTMEALGRKVDVKSRLHGGVRATLASTSSELKALIADLDQRLAQAGEQARTAVPPRLAPAADRLADRARWLVSEPTRMATVAAVALLVLRLTRRRR